MQPAAKPKPAIRTLGAQRYVQNVRLTGFKDMLQQRFSSGVFSRPTAGRTTRSSSEATSSDRWTSQRWTLHYRQDGPFTKAHLVTQRHTMGLSLARTGNLASPRCLRHTAAPAPIRPSLQMNDSPSTREHARGKQGRVLPLRSASSSRWSACDSVRRAIAHQHTLPLPLTPLTT